MKESQSILAEKAIIEQLLHLLNKSTEEVINFCTQCGPYSSSSLRSNVGFSIITDDSQAASKEHVAILEAVFSAVVQLISCNGKCSRPE